MKRLWNLYATEHLPFLADLAATPPLERLRHVGMNCGCEYTAFPRFQACAPYSRFDHSVGVALMLWHFTGSPAQAAAGLLHDVATPVFAHVVDFLNGDHLRQVSTEAGTRDIIAASPELQAALARHGLATEDVAEDRRYPLANNPTPRLSADRLEYTLGNLVNYGFASMAQTAGFYRDLTVWENEDGLPELAFSTAETAAAFTRAALNTARVYVADEDRFAMELLADLLRTALDRGVLTPADLMTTERSVIALLEADGVCAGLWKRFCGFHAVSRRAERPDEGIWVQVPAKLRRIDPLLVGRGRVSRWDPQAAELLADFAATRFDDWVGTAEE